MKGEHPEGGTHGHQGHEGETPHRPVLVELPGATGSSKLDGSGFRVTIIASRWYAKEVHSLVNACCEELLHKGVADHDLHLIEVAGAFELPYAAARVIHCKDVSHRADAVVCIGCIVKDSTYMAKMTALAVSNGIMKLNVTSDVPVIFGVLCCKNEEQAHACTVECVSGGGGSGKKCNHGVSWAQSALEMAHLKRSAASKKEKCHCTRCASEGAAAEGKKEHGKHAKAAESCTTCGSSAERCACSDCKCHSCAGKRGECSSCGASADKCSCKDCKCAVCCASREACRTCGCPPGKCSCEDCKCSSSCCSKSSTSEPMAKSPSSEATSTSTHAESSRSTGASHGEPGCAKCGSPGGKCMCGLLH